MKPTKHSFKTFRSVSGALLLEDMRRFWLIPAIAFLACFAAGGLPLLDRVKSESAEYIVLYYSTSMSSFNQIILPVILTVLSVTVAVGVFSYLHSRESAVISHGLPFRRSTVFVSHTLSGWLLIMTPIVLSALVFVLICAVQKASGVMISIDSSSYSDFMAYYALWTVRACITATYIYILSVLAAVISGTIFTHFLLSLFLNGLAPVLVFIVNRYMSFFVNGLRSAPLAVSQMSPLFIGHRFYYADPFDTPWHLLLFFLALSVVLFFVSGGLYKKIRLEREGNSVVFKTFGEIVCLLFALIGMYFFGFISVGKPSLFLLFSVIGSLLFYLIARMILEKSVQVFHKNTLKGYGIFLLMGTLFISFLAFDISGFEKRVPNAEDVAYVELCDGIGRNDEDFKIVEATKEVEEFHKVLTEKTTASVKFDEADDFHLTFVYHLRSGKTMYRTYYVNYKADEKIIAAYEKLYKTEEYQQQTMAGKISDSFPITDVMNIFDGNGDKIILDSDRQQSFIRDFSRAFKKDSANRDFRSLFKSESRSDFVYFLDIVVKSNQKRNDQISNYTIYKDDSNMRKVIENYTVDKVSLE